ncbi:MAG TPA: class D sortase [Candidatus Aquicultor sp.]|jgi:LPXTG-site transpeptidase (sortase) family protein
MVKQKPKNKPTSNISKKKSTAPTEKKLRLRMTTRTIAGAVMLLAGAVLLVSLYWPRVYAAFAPAPQINPIVLERGHFWIVIPKIKVDSPVQPAVTKEFLKMGVGHVAGSGYPGENKNTIIAGHNYDPAVWTPQTTFGSLDELTKGDDILVAYKGQVHRYVVKTQRTFKADDPDLYKQTKHEQLTLLTCMPFETTTKRLMVIAMPK